jgi:hypothetical protein
MILIISLCCNTLMKTRLVCVKVVSQAYQQKYKSFLEKNVLLELENTFLEQSICSSDIVTLYLYVEQQCQH